MTAQAAFQNWLFTAAIALAIVFVLAMAIAICVVALSSAPKRDE